MMTTELSYPINRKIILLGQEIFKKYSFENFDYDNLYNYNLFIK